jgi:hypothetical protein
MLYICIYTHMYKYAHTHTHMPAWMNKHCVCVCVCVNKFLGCRQRGRAASKKDEWNKIQGSISFQLDVDDDEIRPEQQQTKKLPHTGCSQFYRGKQLLESSGRGRCANWTAEQIGEGRSTLRHFWNLEFKLELGSCFEMSCWQSAVRRPRLNSITKLQTATTSELITHNFYQSVKETTLTLE